MLIKEFIALVVISFIIAIPIAVIAMDKWLENYANKTSLSWWLFASSGLTAFAIAVLATSWKSWRTASDNPVKALKSE